MKRLATAIAGAGLVLSLTPPAVSFAASNTATSLIPLNDGSQLETRATLNCHGANGSCDFVVAADRRTGDAVDGFPHDLWSRQSTDIRSMDRMLYLDVHADAQYDRVFKEGGHDNVTTIYMGEGPVEKYQTTGRIDATDWHTGQARTNTPVIMCTHIQVVYGGNNITSPSTCAQATFS
ncbi:MAG: hypothetical protein WB777_22810 [Mycobacterium sp.]